MQYKSVLVAAGALASYATAQSADQTSEAIDALSSYIDSIETASAFLALESYATVPSIATAIEAWETSVIGGIAAGQTSAPSFDGLPTEIAGPLSSLGLSIYSAGLAILSSDGFDASEALGLATAEGALTGGSVTGTGAAATTTAASGSGSLTTAVSSTATAKTTAASGSASGAGAASSSAVSAGGAMPTGRAMGAAGALAAGFVGVVMAL